MLSVVGFDSEGAVMWTGEYRESPRTRLFPLIEYDPNGPQNLIPVPGGYPMSLKLGYQRAHLIYNAHKIVRSDGYVLKNRSGPVGVYENW